MFTKEERERLEMWLEMESCGSERNKPRLEVKVRYERLLDSLGIVKANGIFFIWSLRPRMMNSD